MLRKAIESSLFSLALLTGTLVLGCASDTPPPDKASVSNEVTVKATVASVNRSARQLSLTDKNGMTHVVDVPTDVRNFDQIQPGDKVTVRYVESLAVALAKPGDAAQPASVAIAAGTAEAGAKPAAAIGSQITATVQIESVDLKQNVVVFTPPSGVRRAVHVVRPEGQKFIQGLKPGDRVEITYTDALAVSVEKQ